MGRTQDVLQVLAAKLARGASPPPPTAHTRARLSCHWAIQEERMEEQYLEGVGIHVSHRHTDTHTHTHTSPHLTLSMQGGGKRRARGQSPPLEVPSKRRRAHARTVERYGRAGTAQRLWPRQGLEAGRRPLTRPGAEINTRAPLYASQPGDPCRPSSKKWHPPTHSQGSTSSGSRAARPSVSPKLRASLQEAPTTLCTCPLPLPRPCQPPPTPPTPAPRLPPSPRPFYTSSAPNPLRALNPPKRATPPPLPPAPVRLLRLLHWLERHAHVHS